MPKTTLEHAKKVVTFLDLLEKDHSLESIRTATKEFVSQPY